MWKLLWSFNIYHAMDIFSSRPSDVFFSSCFSRKKNDSIKETIGMKCRILFSGGNTKKIYFEMLSADILGSMLNVNTKN